MIFLTFSRKRGRDTFLTFATLATLLTLTFAAPAPFPIPSPKQSPAPFAINDPLLPLPIPTTTTNDGTCTCKCEAQNAAFDEAIALASTAVKAIDQVKLGRDNWAAFSSDARISGSLQAMFGIRMGGFRVPMTEGDGGRVQDVLGVYRGVVGFGDKMKRAGGLGCENECRDFSSADIIDDRDGRAGMTCLRDLDGEGFPRSLAPLKRNQAAIPVNAHIETYSSALPTLILESLAKIIISSHVDAEAAYQHIKNQPETQTQGYAECAFLATRDPDSATANAGSYKYFALSMWLEEIDWANGFAQKRPDTEDNDAAWVDFALDGKNEEEEAHSNSDLRVPFDFGVGGDVDMEQAEKARDMIDAMTKTQLEYRATDSPKPTRHSSFVSVAKGDVAEL